LKNTKKAISLHKLIITRLVLYLSIALMAILLLSMVLDFMYLQYFEKRDLFDKLEINLKEYQEVSEAYLIKNRATMEIVDSDLKVVSSKGLKHLNGHKYTPIEFTKLLEDSSYNQNVDYETVHGTDGKEYTVVLMQSITNKTLKKENEISAFYTYGFLSGTLILFFAAFILFVRSIYKPIQESFIFIQSNITKTPYDKTKANVDLTSLTESKKVMQSYNDMLDEMEQMRKDKETAIVQSNKLISNLSHDLKSPITTIIGYSEVLVQESLGPDEQKEYLTYIHQSASDLNELVYLLFQQMKYQHSDYPINLECGDINSFFRDICANYYMLFDKRGFQVDIRIEEKPHTMYFDKVHMKRAFVNIFENCLSHNATPTKVQIVTETDDSHYTVLFKDDGTGIGEEDRQSIFEPFFQGDDSRSNRHSGLGLYVTRQIIEKHGGSISLAGDPDYKTVFQIQFPC
jgi:signal transduction histidine kinase